MGSASAGVNHDFYWTGLNPRNAASVWRDAIWPRKLCGLGESGHNRL